MVAEEDVAPPAVHVVGPNSGERLGAVRYPSTGLGLIIHSEASPSGRRAKLRFPNGRLGSCLALRPF